ncbi:coiled-coil domain-containing protein 22 homolog [Phymastichus coffea]|uniref:coiled-coil domain-containing protein 22 homolog n=1 Tax=Phymastichus coffea TaxID=108790 RepID=UPI00273C73BD|nr:coiled-coil domain-containing protein 22 homolog [Phymastichus coffea]
MEEVDNIIIHSLRQIGCDVNDSITNLAGFNTELVIEATVKCLEIIKPGQGLNPILPTNMAARFRMGAALAQCCQELGYKGDIGYQTFLYNAEADLRRVFMFLIEKLPKESDKIISEPATKSAQLEKLVSAAIAAQISVPWLPYYCHKKRSKCDIRIKIPFTAIRLNDPPSDCSDEYQHYAVKYKKSFLEQIPHVKYLVPSVIDLNNRIQNKSSLTTEEKIEWLNSGEYDKKIDLPKSDSYSLSRLMSNINLKETKDNGESIEKAEVQKEEVKEEETEEPVKQEKSIEELKAEYERLKVTRKELQAEVKKLFSELAVAKLEEQKEIEKFEEFEEQSRIKLKALELLEGGEENIQKLQESIEAQSNKLISLANQWEEHRLPLIERYRDEREKYSSKASASQKKLDELRLLKKKEKELLEECRSKDQQYAQLVAEVQKLPKEVNRAAYTQRILEIINNVRKQKDEINKILGDTREIQKEINTLTGRVERSFAVVDELIFRDALTNETSRKAYKLLATLHSDGSEIISLVEETGAIVREIRDLEEQVDSENAKNIGANLERITADLAQMRKETAALKAQLQSKNSS